MSEVTQIPAAEWEEWVEESRGTILDVREVQEWELGTLPGATLISMGDVPERLGDLDEDTPLLVVCRSGGRSQQVAAYLNQQGYDAANMAGGMKALGMQD